MPVRVQDRDDQTLAFARKGENRVAVPVVTAGVDDHKPCGRVEHDGISVRTSSGQDFAAQEFDAGRNGLRWLRRRR